MRSKQATAVWEASAGMGSREESGAGSDHRPLESRSSAGGMCQHLQVTTKGSCTQKSGADPKRAQVTPLQAQGWALR